MNQNQMIPFGKYQGQPIETLQNDPQYVDWLLQQSWFRDKHKAIFNIVINKFGEPEETPDHNRIQALFLDEDFRMQFAVNYMRRKGNPTYKVVDEVNCFLASVDESMRDFEEYRKAIEDIRAEAKAIQDKPNDSENSGWRQQFEKEEACRKVLKRLDDFPDRQEEIRLFNRKREDLKRFKTASNYVILSDLSFEKNAVDCSFEIEFPFFERLRPKIEIKPVVGDDYPAILRQMRSNGSNCILYDEFTATGVDESTMTKFFESQGFFVFSLLEIEKTKINGFFDDL